MSGEVWRECASWLTRCGLLRADHRANWPTSSIHDLANTLRDGVLLCNLLNALAPSSVDMKDVNQRPQMAQFLCLRNIRVFLRACHEKLQIREADLFDPSMLFDLSNFHRVLCTLAKLSQCPKAIAKNIQGFSVQRSQSQEDIYKDLQSITPPRPKKPAIDPHEDDLTEYTSYCTRIRDEEIYHDLCSVKGTSAKPPPAQNGHHSGHVSHTFAATREFGAFAALATSTHSLEKRDYVIRELVDTESNYVDVLGKIEKYYMKPLVTCMKPQDLQCIFYRIKDLYEIHSGFLVQLQQATAAGAGGSNNMGAPRLGDVFLTWRERFLLYGDYCSNLTNAQDMLKALCLVRDDTFSKKLLKCQKEHSDGRIQLRDILSVPMQRILKYHLLLDKLVQETQPNHEDFRGLERAKEAMVDVAQYINEVKRDSEVLVLLNNVKESIQNWELPNGGRVADYGRLLLDGELRVKAHDDQKLRSRYVFVFDQVMVMCKTVRENQYSFRCILRLSEWRVDEGSRVGDVGGGRWSARWFLVKRSQDGALTLFARTDDARRRWIAAIGEAIDNIEPGGCRSTDHKFVLHTFEKPVTCHHCSKFLKGRIFQGYLCTVCGSNVHKACIVMSGRCGAPPPAPPPPPSALLNNPLPDHNLHYYMWYVGEMGREVATTRLERRLDGTFLLRVRPHPALGPQDTHYALSLKTDNTVKHMRICQRPIDSIQHYFLSESRFFRSVVELISYYEKTSLKENFVGLNVVLRWPFRRVVATATHDFRPSESGQLPLRAGAKILVLSKEGDSRGWWKGRPLDRHSDYQSGYFPKDCVREDLEFLGTLD